MVASQSRSHLQLFAQLDACTWREPQRFISAWIFIRPFSQCHHGNWTLHILPVLCYLTQSGYWWRSVDTDKSSLEKVWEREKGRESKGMCEKCAILGKNMKKLGVCNFDIGTWSQRFRIKCKYISVVIWFRFWWGFLPSLQMASLLPSPHTTFP